MSKAIKVGKTSKRIFAVIVVISLMTAIWPMNLLSKVSAMESNYIIDKFGTVPEGIIIDLKDKNTATINISFSQDSKLEVSYAKFLQPDETTIATIDNTDYIPFDCTITVTALAIGSTSVPVDLWYTGEDMPVRKTIPLTVKHTIDYSVEYYYDNTIAPDLTQSLSAELGSTIATYEAQSRDGFKFEKTEGLPLFLDENAIEQQNTIKVFYITDNDPQGINIDDVTKIYGDETFTISSVFAPDTVPASKRALTWDSENTQVAEVVAATGVFTIKGTGTSKITVKTENGLTDTCILTVNKASLTVTTEDQTRKVGEDNPLFNVKYSGFVYGEDESALAVKPSASCNIDKNSPAGIYDIMVSGGKAENYVFDYQSGKLTVKADDPKETMPASTPSASSSPTSNAPKTGDMTNLPKIIALMMVGLGGLWFCRKRKVSE